MVVKGAVTVIGLGRVGFPLALVFASRGHKVYGVEVDEDLVRTIREGKVPFMEEGAQELLDRTLGKTFFADTNYAAVGSAQNIVLTLGTPVDEHMNPSFDQIQAALRSMMPHLKKGQLIVLRSTVAPTTTEYLGRTIERTTHLRPGKDIFIAFCPERIAEGKAIEEIPDIPQIVGGLDPQSTKRARDLFASICRTVHASDARSAEIAKLLCNFYRYVDFAIGNEAMIISMQYEREIYEILRLVNDGYKRGGLKSPGFTAGPCLYKDGFFLVGHLPANELVSTAWKINEAVPSVLIEQVKRRGIELETAAVAILGMAFKRNIDDTRNSLAFKLRKLLLAQGAHVKMHDPFLKCDPLDTVLRGSDVVFLGINHDYYREHLRPARLKRLLKPQALICDIWNILGRHRLLHTVAQL